MKWGPGGFRAPWSEWLCLFHFISGPEMIFLLLSLAPGDGEIISLWPPDGSASFQKHPFCRGDDKAPWMGNTWSSSEEKPRVDVSHSYYHYHLSLIQYHLILILPLGQWNLFSGLKKWITYNKKILCAWKFSKWTPSFMGKLFLLIIKKIYFFLDACISVTRMLYRKQSKTQKKKEVMEYK